MLCSERPESAFSMLGEDDNSYEAAWMKTCKQNNKNINVKEGFSKLGCGIQRGVPTMKRNERGENKEVRWDWGVTWGFVQGGVQLALHGRKHLQDGGALESILGTSGSFLFFDLQPCLQFQHLLFFYAIYNLAPSDQWPPPDSNHFMLSSISFCLLSASHSLSFSHSSPYGSDQGQAGRNSRGPTDRSKSLLNHCLQVLCQCLEILWIPKWSQGTIIGIEMVQKNQIIIFSVSLIPRQKIIE